MNPPAAEPPDEATTGLSRQEGVAMWQQIATALRTEIASATHASGARLPTEAALTARFGVNRHTVRRALEALSREGLIRIEQGRGSFVAEDMLDYNVEPRTRFTEWIRRHNREPSGQVRRLIETAADPRVAAALNITDGGTVVLLERLGFADDRPVSLTRHYFPATRLPGILPALQATSRITDALRAVGVADYLRQETRITARMPTYTEAGLLRMARGRPVLVTENIDVDRTGAVIGYAVGCLPTPRVQIVFEP